VDARPRKINIAPKNAEEQQKSKRYSKKAPPIPPIASGVSPLKHSSDRHSLRPARPASRLPTAHQGFAPRLQALVPLERLFKLSQKKAEKRLKIKRFSGKAPPEQV